MIQLPGQTEPERSLQPPVSGPFSPAMLLVRIQEALGPGLWEDYLRGLIDLSPEIDRTAFGTVGAVRLVVTRLRFREPGLVPPKMREVLVNIHPEGSGNGA